MVIVIGAGIGGMASAIRLAQQGYPVKVFEKNPQPGGKMSEIREQGYRFDTGPSLFTLPGLIDDLPGQDTKLNYQKLETVSKYFFPDGEVFIAPAEPDEFSRDLSAAAGEDQRKVLRYLDEVERLYDLTAPLFIFNSFHRINKLFKQENLGVLTAMLKFNPMRSMHRHNAKNLTSEKAIQIFDRYATYNGSNPFKAPATLNMIAHLEHTLGAYFPEGGMYNIIRHMYDLAKSKNVTFHFNREVSEICVEGNRAVGIIANGEKHSADIIVSGGDVFRTYNDLLKPVRPHRSVRKPRLSSSAMIFYLGVNNTYDELDVHNIFFTGDYPGEFKNLFSKKQAKMFTDPTVYIYNSSKIEKGDAPPGCSNLFIMINVPADKGEDWDKFSIEARTIILDKLKREHNLDIESGIEFETIATPKTIGSNTLTTAGALYGNNSNSIWSAFNRHPNFSRKIKNLFFAGGSVHPGGGIPLCMASARIVEEEVLNYTSTFPPGYQGRGRRVEKSPLRRGAYIMITS